MKSSYLNLSAKVSIVTLIKASAKSVAVSSLQPDDMVEVRNYGHGKVRWRIVREGKPLHFGLTCTDHVSDHFHQAINTGITDELECFNTNGAITEDLITQLLVGSFPDLHIEGCLLPESNGYLGKYLIQKVTLAKNSSPQGFASAS